MDKTKFIWMNWNLVKWDEAKIHVLTHTLHYWWWAFEWIRVYNWKKWPAIFRLNDHVKRLFYSASCLNMKIPYSIEEIKAAIIKTVRENQLEEWYIRPLAFYWYWKMWLNPTWAPLEISIACWPWGSYLADKIDIKITKYIRIHPKSSITDAKITWHYVNSILSVLELEWTKYQEALLLDYEWNIAEWPWENFFIVKNWKILTPPLWKILKWITRRTVFEICNYLWIEIEEKEIRPEEAFWADEAFFTWTAAKVTTIASIDDNVIWNWNSWPITNKIKNTYKDIVTWNNEDFIKYLEVV